MSKSVIIVFLLVAALCLGGTGNNTVKPATEAAIIETCLLDDLPAHRILIPGEDGTDIYIRELKRSYTVESGYAVIETSDHIWYDTLDNPDEIMEIMLTPFLMASSGRLDPLPVISYAIVVPQSPVELESPDSLRTVTTSTMVPIKVVVRPGSRVTVNGEDCSDIVHSQTGAMTYNANVKAIGDNIFNISVRSEYCRENTLQVVIYRETQEIPLDLAAGTYATTNQKAMKIIAVTRPGASVEVTTPYTDLDITNLNSTGKFSFTAIFDHIGDNTISITASYPGNKPSRIDHNVYYVPSVEEYTKNAWALDAANYSDLLNTIALRASKNQVYVVKGIVQYSISENPQMVVINSSDDGKSQPVLLENNTKMKWVVGQYYRIYADAYSAYNGMPYLIARYTYDK